MHSPIIEFPGFQLCLSVYRGFLGFFHSGNIFTVFSRCIHVYPHIGLTSTVGTYLSRFPPQLTAFL